LCPSVHFQLVPTSITTSRIFRRGAFIYIVLSAYQRDQERNRILREMAYNFPGVPATAMPPMGKNIMIL